MQIKITTENIGDNGLQSITGTVGDTVVITLRDGVLDREGIGQWKVSSSTSLPTRDLDKARSYVKCMQMTLAKLEELQMDGKTQTN